MTSDEAWRDMQTDIAMAVGGGYEWVIDDHRPLVEAAIRAEGVDSQVLTSAIANVLSAAPSPRIIDVEGMVIEYERLLRETVA